MTPKEQLIELYSNKSKHSNYQVLATKLRNILTPEDVSTTSRSEQARLKYLLEKIDFIDKSMLDIGANTGYFSFELLDAGAKSMHYYEGNNEHAEFVRLASSVLGLGSKLKITNGYFNFDGSHDEKYDIALLFNVLHHVGDDYGDKNVSIDQAKELIITQLNNMSLVADKLVFQLGFNWQGNPSLGLFKNGTKKEVIEFVRNGSESYWSIDSIGIAERNGDNVKYVDLNDKNIERDDSLGEFLNRPIFILSNKS